MGFWLGKRKFVCMGRIQKFMDTLNSFELFHSSNLVTCMRYIRCLPNAAFHSGKNISLFLCCIRNLEDMRGIY